MDVNVFTEKDVSPTKESIRAYLGNAYPVLLKVRESVQQSVGDTKEEWKYYGKKHGWSLKTFLKKRNLFFIGIRDGYFLMGFIFGQKAVDAVMESDISDDLKKQLANARKYAEGQGISMEVKDETYLKDIKKLLVIKVNN